MSPIDTLVLLSGSTAVINTYAPTPAYTANPSAGAFSPPAPTPTTITGLFSRVTVAGIALKYNALFLVGLISVSNMIAGQSRLTIFGQTFSCEDIDPRYYLGVQDGWTFHLKL